MNRTFTVRSQLSPLNFSGLIHLRGLQTEQQANKTKARAIECWRCVSCEEVYDDECEAEDCCAGSSHPEDAPTNCPVCGKTGTDHRDASDCCLWKDFDGPTRWAMADKVEAGSTWAEVLNISHH